MAVLHGDGPGRYTEPVNEDFVFRNQEELVGQVISFFFASVLGPQELEKVVEVCLKNPDSKKRGRDHFIKKGQFALTDFLHYWSTVLKPGGGTIDICLIERLLERFCTWNLLGRCEFLSSFGVDYYAVNTPLAEILVRCDALENVAFDFPYLVDKYSDAVLHLVVTDQEGDIWSGTGFLFMAQGSVLTNKHVVEEDANRQPRVLTPSGEELHAKRIIISETSDLALIELQVPVDARPLFPMPHVELLYDVITLGFPRIPLSTKASLIAHKGEINGRVMLAHGERLLFSAKTAPGNSGGPLLNRMGMMVGVVTEELQSDMSNCRQAQGYFAAIPVETVIAFVNEAIPPDKPLAGNEPAASKAAS